MKDCCATRISPLLRAQYGFQMFFGRLQVGIYFESFSEILDCGLDLAVVHEGDAQIVLREIVRRIQFYSFLEKSHCAGIVPALAHENTAQRRIRRIALRVDVECLLQMSHSFSEFCLSRCCET